MARQQGSLGEGALRAPLLTALRLLLIATGLLPWILACARVRSAALVATFHLYCHQLPERTLSLFGAPMLVCSRCAGVYAGVALGALLPLPRRFLPWGRHLVIAAIALGIADVVTQDAGLHPPFHPARLGTGLLMGFAGSAFMFGALRKDARVEKPTGPGPEEPTAPKEPTREPPS